MRRYILTLAVTSSAMTFAFTGLSSAQCGGGMHSSGHSGHAGAATSESKIIVYPIDYCVVSGEKLGDMGDPVKYEFKDRTLHFCCKGCIKKFEAEPAKYLAVLDAAMVNATASSAKTATVPESNMTAEPGADSLSGKATPKLTTLDWCIVSGETLGDMGKPVAYKWKDREMDFCCKSCVKIFEKQPLAYVARLDSALAGHIVQPKPAEEKPKKEEQHGGHTH